MHYTTLLALAMGSVASAQLTPTPTSGMPEPTGKAGPKAGLIAGGFIYKGCYSGSFVGFKKRGANSPSNGPDSCGRLCEGSRYLGLYADSCYCSEEELTEEAKREGDDVCSAVCPGDKTATCGALLKTARSVRRQEGVPPNVAISVYVSEEYNSNNKGDKNSYNNNKNSNNKGNNIDSYNGNNNGDRNNNNNNNNGDIIINGDITVNMVCYGDWCVPKEPCKDCPRYRVVCWGKECKPEICPEGEDWMRKVECEGEHCKWSDCRKTNTCEIKVECEGEECKCEKIEIIEEKKKIVCVEECKPAACTGPDCFTKEVCVGEVCKVETQGVPSQPPSPPSVGPSVLPPSSGGNVVPPSTTPPPIAGSSKMAASAGLAALVAGAVFLL